MTLLQTSQTLHNFEENLKNHGFGEVMELSFIFPVTVLHFAPLLLLWHLQVLLSFNYHLNNKFAGLTVPS